MDGNKGREEKEITVFGLVVLKKPVIGAKSRFVMTAAKRGLPHPDIIMRMRAFLEKLETDFKGNAMKDASFYDLGGDENS